MRPAPTAALDESDSILLLDVVATSVLVTNHNGEFVRILERNTAMPTKKIREIILANDNTQQVEVNVSTLTLLFT